MLSGSECLHLDHLSPPPMMMMMVMMLSGSGVCTWITSLLHSSALAGSPHSPCLCPAVLGLFPLAPSRPVPGLLPAAAVADVGLMQAAVVTGADP